LGPRDHRELKVTREFKESKANEGPKDYKGYKESKAIQLIKDGLQMGLKYIRQTF